ncbi:MAG: alpha/beta hydrolase [Syntrophales bacterium]|jgi:pimeloyl-ACP methyl ester carboxylesterase|nr:alpha/beta hydrolase [Syntrophales bacterium]MDY0043442.1 alpha/beta hydrolase [Syntrophales bacterium]
MLIFIHGSGGTREAFKYQIDHFTASIAVNLPGHPDGEPCRTINEYTDWLHGFIKERNMKNLFLAGHSLGGGIALSYALEYPGDLDGLILLGSGLRLRVHPVFLETLEKACQEPSTFESFAGSNYERMDPELAAIIKARVLENGPAVMLNDMRACDAFDIMDRKGEITVPTLAICGTEDIMTPPKYSYFIEKNIPGARAVLIEGGTHFVFAEKPEEVNEAIDKFLKSVSSE